MMETNLKKGQTYVLTKAPKNKTLQGLIGGQGTVRKVIHEKTHRSFEVLINGILLGFTAAELRAKTFVFARA